MLGDKLYDLVQRREDEGQAVLLKSLMAPNSSWAVHTDTLSITNYCRAGDCYPTLLTVQFLHTALSRRRVGSGPRRLMSA